MLLNFINYNVKDFTPHKFDFFVIFVIIINLKNLNSWQILKKN